MFDKKEMFLWYINHENLQRVSWNNFYVKYNILYN